MRQITRKQAVKELDHYNEQIARWAVDLENEFEGRMENLQKILLSMDKFQKQLRDGKPEGR